MPINKLAIVRGSDDELMPKPEDKPIKAYIVRVMKEEGWSQAKVLENAKALKISLRQATLSEIITGETTDPRIFTLIDISRALHRPFGEMVAAIQGSETARTATFDKSDFALMSETYDQLNAKPRVRADDVIEMVKGKLIELLKQQDQTNPAQPRK
jgi:transcriptional regulator with XRE-family HTH domain